MELITNPAVINGDRKIFHSPESSCYTVFEYSVTGWKQIARIPYKTAFTTDVVDDWKSALQKAKTYLPK